MGVWRWLRRGLARGLVVTAALAWAAAPTLAAPAMTTETIVLVRHAEKPAAGLGQLDCQGLNRALALPAVLIRAFGRPDAIYAPDPAEQKADNGQDYDYVRPLATIEPTAIAAGLPVHAEIGVSRLDQLRRALEAPEWHGAVVFVAWEHHGLVTLARALLSGHGGTAAVPDWAAGDFDGMFIIRLRWTGDRATAAFERRAEGLDAQPATCAGMGTR